MTLKPTLGRCALALILMGGSARWLDERLTLFCRRHLFNPGSHPLLPFELPDLLLPTACLATGVAWVAFLVFRKEGHHDRALKFFRLLGTTVPLAYLFKSVGKFMVGRINTRTWLEQPTAAHFHGFSGLDAYASFPSGHMAVFTVMAAALSAHYPRWRTQAYTGLAALAVALLVTQYHFLSDILGGTCLGLLIHAGTEALLPNGCPVA